MKYVTLSVLLLSALAAGNPIITTFINEFGFDDDGLGWAGRSYTPRVRYTATRWI